MIHLCHAYECRVELQSPKVMCDEHWKLVPPKIKAVLLEAYEPGKEFNDEFLHQLNRARNHLKVRASIES